MTDHAKLRELAEAAPDGEWEIWTSCSWRRIYAKDRGKTSMVIEPCVQRTDNHPDLMFGRGVAEFIEYAGNPKTVLALLDEIDRLNAEWMAKCEELRKDALRYKWLRDGGREQIDMFNSLWGESLDWAIDSELAKKEGA